MHKISSLILLALILTLGHISVGGADTDTKGKRPYICNATDSVNFVEGVADPFRLVIGGLAELKTRGSFEACWFNIKRRLFETGNVQYYFGILLVFLGLSLAPQIRRIFVGAKESSDD